MIVRVAGATRDHLAWFPGSPTRVLCGKRVELVPLRGFKPMCKTCKKVIEAKPELLSDNVQETSTAGSARAAY